ncbi:hypothetical protein TWF718_006727 [Orbilia javanica]|uniref:Uncharacterized protein n=1 Tax=Orbilia javanica TaxID=47235 RepID=A0AAN8RHN0_9PEZI
MAAFAALEAAVVIQRAVISKKAGEFNEKLKTVDVDISSRINPAVNDYIVKYKANNNFIASKAPAGLDTRTCRSLLLQFMAEVEKREGKIDAAKFRKYAESARILYNSKEIDGVYDALGELNLSGKTDKDIQKFLGVLKGLNYSGTALSIIRGASIAIMYYKLNIARNTIEVNAKAAGFEVVEVESSVFGMLDALGKFVAVVAVVMSVVDAVLGIIDIIDVVEQTKKMCDELGGSIKDAYKSYFKGIKTAAQQYKAATTKTETKPAT